MSNLENTNPLVVGLHGFAQGPSHFDRLKPEIESRGFDFIAPDLIEDPEATFDDSAREVAKAIKGVKKCLFVVHSRSGNVAPRVPDLLEKDVEIEFLYVAASFVEETIGHPTKEEKEKGIVPDKNNPDYIRSIVRINEHLARYDTRRAVPLLFSDRNLPSELINHEASRFRPQRRFGKEPELKRWPSEVPMHYVVCTRDCVLNKEWQEYAAIHWVKTNPIYRDWDHMAPLTHANKLGPIVVARALKMAGR